MGVLGPLKKFQKYNHFPYKLVAHILLMIICTAQVILVIGSSGSYSRSQQNLFYRLFLDDEFESEDPATEKIVHEFSLTEFSGKVRTYLDNYYSLGEEVNDYFEDYKLVAPKESGYEVPVAILDVFYLPGVPIKDQTETRHVFAEGEYGIFSAGNEQNLKEALRNAKYSTMSYEVLNKVPMNNAKNNECFKWDITQRFDFEQRNHITISLQAEKAY